MLVKVTKTDKSQNGKDRVYLDGRHDWKDAFYVKAGQRIPTVGAMIEADTSSTTFPGKKEATWFLNSYKAVNMGGATPVAGNGTSPPSEPPAQLQKGWDIQSGDLSRYASNIVASAITAGLVKVPGDINAWARAAYLSGQNLRQGYAEWSANGPDPSTHAGDPGFGDDDLPPSMDQDGKGYPF